MSDDGQIVLSGGTLLPTPTALAIVQFDQFAFNLLHLDATGDEMTDTFHETLDDALDQAFREFRVRPEDWLVVSEEY